MKLSHVCVRFFPRVLTVLSKKPYNIDVHVYLTKVVSTWVTNNGGKNRAGKN